jgi:ornithine carbamoyltransferase
MAGASELPDRPAARRGSGRLASALDPSSAWPAHVLCPADLPCQALVAVLDLAAELERDGDRHREALAGEPAACLFEPTPGFEPLAAAAAAERLGMAPVLLRREELPLDDAEAIADAGAVLSRSAAVLLTHAIPQRTLKRLAASITVPVVNLLSDRQRPCHALADLLTLRDRFGDLSGLRLAFVGDGGASVAHSLMEAGALAAMEVWLACPPAHRPDRLTEFGAQVVADRHGGRVVVTDDAAEAVAGAQAVYATSWVPPGHEAEREARVAALRRYRVDLPLMRLAARDAVFMACLPAHRGEEVAAQVIDGRRSLVREQAANGVPVQEALILALVNAARRGDRSRV